MTRAVKLWRRWVEVMDRREPATALAIVRIGIAVVLATDLLWLWHLGLVDVLFRSYPDGYATSFAGWTDGPTLWAIAVMALVMIGIGLATPVACGVFVLVSAQLSLLAPDSESAIDALHRVVLVILALSRCNAKWSVDAWLMRRLGRPMRSDVPAWPRYLIMLQLVWVYFSGGHNKSSAAWGPFGGFAALGNSLLDPHAAGLSPSLVTAIYPLTRIATALTMVFELGAPIYLLAYVKNWKRVRWAWLGLGVAFEIGIAIGLRLGSFPFGMLVLFPALLRPEELYRRNTETPA